LAEHVGIVILDSAKGIWGMEERRPIGSLEAPVAPQDLFSSSVWSVVALILRNLW
jgi:hypothetical protein